MAKRTNGEPPEAVGAGKEEPRGGGYCLVAEPEPTTAADFVDRGIRRTQGGHYRHAAEDFETAIGLEPHLVKAYCARAAMHIETGHFTEAVVDCTEAIRLNPATAVAYHLRAIARAWKDDLASAKLDFLMSGQLDPNLHLLSIRPTR